MIKVCLLMGCGALMAALPARAVTYWASGSSYESGWFDFGQQGGTSCGRAAAASLIYWWQRESKLENPVDATVSQIFDKLEKQFQDSGDPTTGGSFVHDCVKWYMSEFYPEVDMNKTYWQSQRFRNPSTSPNQTSDPKKNARHVSDLIKNCLSKGLLVAVDTGAHALTLWGAEFDDATGFISKIWVADPGLESEYNALECLEVYTTVASDPDNRWLAFEKKIWREDGTGYDTVSMNVRWLYTLTPIPEPSSAFLLGGVGLLALCACRRRRRSRAK